MRTLLALSVLPALSYALGVTCEQANIISKSKVEIPHSFISCGLNDIAIITAPVTTTNSLYYLHKPNHEILKLNLPRPKNRTDDNLKYLSRDVNTIYPMQSTRVVHPRHHSNEDVVKNAEMGMNENEFIVGPLSEEDHGNWVLSVYLKDLDDEWIEMFQVITIEVVERVPLLPSFPTLREGEDLRLSLASPITHLESCELVAPSSTYDRFYDRSPVDTERCGYTVRNVTKADEGVWEIYGVGKMVFAGSVYLKVT